MNKPTPTQLERFLVAAFVLALLGGAVIVMSFVNLPTQNQSVVFQLVGGINTLSGLVVAFYFRTPSDAPKDTASASPPPKPIDLPSPKFGQES